MELELNAQTAPQFPNLFQFKHNNLLQTFTAKSFQDLLFRPQTQDSSQHHLEAAISWLKRAHDASPDAGVSWGYSLKGGWRSSYPETSGYIAVTFFELARQLGDGDARRRAIAIAYWLLQVQNADGSFSNPRYGNQGIVFDTGQVLLGLVRAGHETGDGQFFRAAERAGNWLVAVADTSGRWTRCTHNGIPHVYNTRSAWALLQLHQRIANPAFEQVARANLDWAVSQQHNGLFDQCAFVPDAAPFTHTIAYTIRGLLESGLILHHPTYLESARRAAEVMITYIQQDGFIPGQIAVDGTPMGHYCCLTGNCQMAILWLKLFAQTGDRGYYVAAHKAIRYVMGCQDLHTTDLNIRGGIKGSHPIWGKYARLSYPNWAAKFFIDALLLLRTHPYRNFCPDQRL